MRFCAFLIFIIMLMTGPVVYGQNGNNAGDCVQKANNLLDEAITLMRKHYYKKDSVQWDELITSAKKRLENSTDCAAAHETLQWCFKEMKERHSFVMPAAKAAEYNGNINSSPSASTKPNAGPIRHEMAEEGIAYIDVPWVTTADKIICIAFADSLQQLIESYDKLGVTKWIIDLRNNTGGNCWPMLAGLGPLLGNGVHGYFVSSNENIPFSYQDGSVMQGKYNRCRVTKPYTLTGNKKTIIVLTGPNTASAGEIVALAFKGIPGVHFYGEPTAGLTTANATYKLSDGSMLVLTVCKEADRHGNIYEGRLQPDKLIRPIPIGGKDVVKTSALMFLQLD